MSPKVRWKRDLYKCGWAGSASRRTGPIGGSVEADSLQRAVLERLRAFTVDKGNLPRSVALFANLAISIPRMVGTRDIAEAMELNSYQPNQAVALATP